MGTSSSHQENYIQHPKLKNGIIQENYVFFVINEQNNDWCRKVAIFKSNFSQNSLFFPKKIQKISFDKIKLCYQLYSFTLKNEIQTRKTRNESFLQSELWYILYKILQGSSCFEQMKQKSGDVRPINILLNKDGAISLLNKLSFPNELTNYEKAQQSFEPSYLSPEELIKLEEKSILNKINPFISQSFSIGLTILDAALLKDSQTLYDLNEIKFKVHQLNNSMYLLKQKQYSQFFVQTVLNLLKFKAEERPSPGQTFAILLPYRNQILTQKEFQPIKNASKYFLDQYHTYH